MRPRDKSVAIRGLRLCLGDWTCGWTNRTRQAFAGASMIAASLSAVIVAASPAQARWFFEPEPAARPRHQDARPRAPPARPIEPQRQAQDSIKGAKTPRQTKAPEKLPAGPLQHRDLDQAAAAHRLCQRPAVRAFAGLDRRARPSDAAGRVQRDPEEPASPFQPLQRRADALHAAHHLVGRGDARRAVCPAIRRRTAASACRANSRSACGA